MGGSSPTTLDSGALLSPCTAVGGGGLFAAARCLCRCPAGQVPRATSAAAKATILRAVAPLNPPWTFSEGGLSPTVAKFGFNEIVFAKHNKKTALAPLPAQSRACRASPFRRCVSICISLNRYLAKLRRQKKRCSLSVFLLGYHKRGGFATPRAIAFFCSLAFWRASNHGSSHKAALCLYCRGSAVAAPLPSRRVCHTAPPHTICAESVAKRQAPALAVVWHFVPNRATPSAACGVAFHRHGLEIQRPAQIATTFCQGLCI